MYKICIQSIPKLMISLGNTLVEKQLSLVHSSLSPSVTEDNFRRHSNQVRQSKSIIIMKLGYQVLALFCLLFGVQDTSASYGN